MRTTCGLHAEYRAGEMENRTRIAVFVKKKHGWVCQITFYIRYDILTSIWLYGRSTSREARPPRAHTHTARPRFARPFPGQTPARDNEMVAGSMRAPYKRASRPFCLGPEDPDNTTNTTRRGRVGKQKSGRRTRFRGERRNVHVHTHATVSHVYTGFGYPLAATP